MRIPCPLSFLASFAAIVLLAATDAWCSEGRISSQPNVLMLCVDDMKDWVNCLGGYEGRVHTPNIDRLAARGTLFTNAHCASPKCAPSRSALLTGMRPSTTGLYDNSHWWLANLPEVVTLPRHFKDHGYEVVGAGKVFHHTAGNQPPNQWDAFHRIAFREDPWFRGHQKNYPWSEPTDFPPGFPFGGVTGLGHENDWGSLAISDDEYDDVITADHAIRFLDDRNSSSGKPFFLACGFFRPHLPWYAPKKYFRQYPLDQIVLPTIAPDDLNDVPKAGRKLAADRRTDLDQILGQNQFREAVRAYLASITYADDQVGRVLNALQRCESAERTIVILWSDHGWHLGEKNHWHKSTLWEEATRVPLIVSVPGLPAGRCGQPVSLIDLFPTLCELAGLTSLDCHDGTSLVELLRDDRARRSRPAVIEYLRGNAAVRSVRYRYIRYADGSEELYDHRIDPREWKNLADDPSLADVKRELSRWITRQWAKPGKKKQAFDFDYQTFTWTDRATGAVVRGSRE